MFKQICNYKKFIGISSITVFSYIYTKSSTRNQYTYSDIAKHNKKDIWVTYKNKVYDVTKFIDSHPGGKDKIMLAAGKGLEPYWNIYKQHNKKVISEILEPMKIGYIKDYDPNKYNNIKDPYINDPIRSSELIYHNVTPCNAETPLNEIMDNWITSNNLWYIRNHTPVPKIDINKYKLDINGRCFSIDEIKKLKSKKIISTIQCGGNRRSGFNKLEKTLGTPWNKGAISNAEWTGIPLYKLLTITNKTKHVHFEGMDGVKASIPIEKAMNPNGDVMIAYKMNGEDIPRDHGYPLRVIVPGHVGIRNIKWLKSIKISDKEIDGVWQSGLSYKILPHYIKDVSNINIKDYPSIQEMPVQSSIVEHQIIDNKIIIKGFAWSGGGRGIVRVDVSIDGGVTWKIAKLKEGYEQPFNRCWAWLFWEIDFPKNKNLNIICKAIDSANNVQSSHLDNIWNIRGLNNNSWDICN